MSARLLITTSGRTIQRPLPPSARVVVGPAAFSAAASGEVLVQDLGGGVLINGAPVERGQLRPGDVATAGASEVRLELEPEPAVRLTKDGLDLSACTLSGVHPRDRGLEARFGLLLQMAQSVGADLGHQQVLDKLMSILFQALRPERAALALLEPEGGLRFEVARTAGGGEPWRDLQVSGTILNRVIRSGEAFVTADAVQEQVHSIAAKGIRSAMCAPFHQRGAVAGALYADHRGATHRFDEADLDFLIVLSHLASVAIQNVVDYQAIQRENARLRQLTPGAPRLVGESDAIQRLHATLRKIARSELPVLIVGERGTGKELAARALHDASPREVFVPVNCAAIPESLGASARVGHERGAFTGADRQHRGYFEQAHGGTLFLDEIGDLKPAAQAAILRALQEGEIRRVGGDGTIAVDVRVVSATNRDLARELEAGRFRGDLRDRLNVLRVAVPPLRERIEDVPLLAAHFAAERVRRISAKALQLLRSYAWPGNVRELKNAIDRAVVMGDGETIWPEDLPASVREGEPERHHLPTLDSLERDHVIRVLRFTGGNVSQAAKILGIRRVTIYKKLKGYGLEPGEFKPRE